MKQVKELFSDSVAYLEGVLEPKNSVEKLLGDVISCAPKEVYLHFDQLLTLEQEKLFKDHLERRKKSEPVEYILKKVFFYESEFFINQDVLIPRLETELLVDLVVEELKGQNLKEKTLWDICTGSGCIGISIKKKLPDLKVVCSDICPKALEIAKKNAELNSVQIDFLNGDLLDPFQKNSCDYLVSNPPYISFKDKEWMDEDVKGFEPSKALFAPDEGLECYKRFKLLMPQYLKTGAKAFFEMGYNQKKEIENLFFDSNFKDLRFIKDYPGKDRFFFLEIE